MEGEFVENVLSEFGDESTNPLFSLFSIPAFVARLRNRISIFDLVLLKIFYEWQLFFFMKN